MHGRTGTTAAPPAPPRERSRLSKAFFRCCARAARSTSATSPLQRAELEACRAQSGTRWDKDEIYFVFDELKKAFPAMTFDRLSPCSGILSLRK